MEMGLDECPMGWVSAQAASYTLVSLQWLATTLKLPMQLKARKQIIIWSIVTPPTITR